MKQRTISQPFEMVGIGLHSGKPVKLQFSSAEPDTGIVFFRSDVSPVEPIWARYDQVTDTLMSSNLTNTRQQRIGTVEHLMSAIAGLGIDNLAIQVSAPEIPIMDGSSYPFFEALCQIGLIEQPALKKFIRVLKPVRVVEGDKFAQLLPNKTAFTINFQINFAHPAFANSREKIEMEFSRENFIQQIAPARTFGFMKDVEMLKQQNLGLGGSMENAILLDDTRILNPEGLRFKDEFTRHKILDAIGDLYLAGHQLLADFHAYKTGHALNNLLLKKLFSDTKYYEVVTFDDATSCQIQY